MTWSLWETHVIPKQQLTCSTNNPPALLLSTSVRQFYCHKRVLIKYLENCRPTGCHTRGERTFSFCCRCTTLLLQNFYCSERRKCIKVILKMVASKFWKALCYCITLFLFTSIFPYVVTFLWYFFSRHLYQFFLLLLWSYSPLRKKFSFAFRIISLLWHVKAATPLVLNSTGTQVPTGLLTKQCS